MSWYDPLEEFSQTLRELRRRIGLMLGEMMEYSEYVASLFEERVESLRQGYTEPLVSFQDLGDKLAIIVDLPGAKGGTTTIQLGENTLSIESVVDERIVREALWDSLAARSVRRFRGVYRLPCKVDPSRAERIQRGSTLVILAPKKGECVA